MNEMNNQENEFNNQDNDYDLNNYNQSNLNQEVNNLSHQNDNNHNVDSPKKSYRGLLIIFMIISLFLAGFIVYDKALKKEEIPKQVETNIDEDKNQQNNNESEVVEELIDNYKIISETVEGYKKKFYLVKKSASSTHDYEVVKYLGKTLENFESYFGFYNNKIYYSDEQNIKYIDLTDKSLTEKIWVKLPKEDDALDGPVTAFNDAMIMGDSLYLTSYEDSQLGYLSLNASSFDEYKAIENREAGSFVEDWIAIGDEDIYYSMFDYDVEKTSVLYKYNIKTKDVRKIMVLGASYTFYYTKDNIIYCKGTNERKSENEYVYNLFAYNIGSTKTTKIADLIFNGRNELCSSYFTAHGTNAYYYNDGAITKYNVINGSTSEYYKVTTNYVGGMRFIDDNNMIFMRYTNRKEYVSNGKQVESLPTFKVLMLNNGIKEFGMEVFSSIK